jgi:GR25 family glycosyltransferase involved in LPS biosynthesis
VVSDSKRQDRREHTSRFLGSLGIRFEFVDAVTPENIGEVSKRSDMLSALSKHTIWNDSAGPEMPDCTALTMIQCCIAWSHIVALARFHSTHSNNSNATALIMEDDPSLNHLVFGSKPNLKDPTQFIRKVGCPGQRCFC